MRALLFVLVLALGRPSAVAQADPTETALARTLFREGLALARAGTYPAAIERFERALVLRPSPPIVFNLALALQHEGRLVEASERFIAVARDESADAALRASASEREAALELLLGHLTLHVEGAIGPVEVELDARRIPSAAIDVPLPADPGEHHIRVLRGELELTQASLTLAEGESRELTLTIPHSAIAPPASSPETIFAPAPEVTPSDDGPWIALGVISALVVVGGGVVLAVVLIPGPAPDPVRGNTMPPVLSW